MNSDFHGGKPKNMPFVFKINLSWCNDSSLICSTTASGAISTRPNNVTCGSNIDVEYNLQF